MKSDQRQDLACDGAAGSPQQLWPLNGRDMSPNQMQGEQNLRNT